MKKYRFAVIFLCLLLLFTDCSEFSGTRKIIVVIPEHPWEKYAHVKLWYNLTWQGIDGLETVYIDQHTREVEICIPVGRTVFICAYPLGEMRAFGCVVTPYDKYSVFEMNQNDGYLSDLLLNTDVKAASEVNWYKLHEVAQSQTTDFRTIDDIVLVKNVLNGTLEKSSVVSREKITVPSFAAPGGTWISESVFDSRIIFAGNESPELILPYGVNRFYNYERNLELRVVIDLNGDVFTYQRQAMVSSLNAYT